MTLLRTIIILFLAFSMLIGEEKKSKKIALDIVKVHGMTLKGRVTHLGSRKLSFRLLGCEGVNHIDYKDIDYFVTKYKYQISYNRKEVVGRVLGIIDKESLKVEVEGRVILIKITSIDNFIMSVQDNDSLENRIRNSLPYTSGDMSIGIELEEGSNYKVKSDMMMNWWHKKAQNEFHIFVDFSNEKTSTEDTQRVENKDELATIITDKFFYDKNDFMFGSFVGEFDRPRHIQSRYVPSLGYGHHFEWSKNQWIQPSVGLAHVSTHYTDENLYPDIRFVASALGLSGKYQIDNIALINKLIIDGNLIYYPSLKYPKRDWILRSKLDFIIPLFEFISMRLSMQWINDSNPDPTIGNNKTTTNLLFGVDF